MQVHLTIAENKMYCSFYIGLWGFFNFCFVFGNEKQCLFCLFQPGTEVLGKDCKNRKCRFVSVTVNILFAPKGCAISWLFSLNCKHVSCPTCFKIPSWFRPLFRLGLFHLTEFPPLFFMELTVSTPRCDTGFLSWYIPFPCPSGTLVKECMVRFSVFNLLSLLSHILSEPLV